MGRRKAGVFKIRDSTIFEIGACEVTGYCEWTGIDFSGANETGARYAHALTRNYCNRKRDLVLQGIFNQNWLAAFSEWR